LVDLSQSSSIDTVALCGFWGTQHLIVAAHIASTVWFARCRQSMHLVAIHGGRLMLRLIRHR
jgi:hypothetical protein